MRRYLLLLPIVLMCVGVVAAQQPAVTFRAEINFVEVHAIVTDEKGAFVRDLTRDDLEVYEDGKLQSPTVFSLVDVPIEPPFTPANRTEPIDPDVRSTTRSFNGRIYVLLLDDLHTNITRTPDVRDVAKRFIDEYLGESDLAAVVYTGGRQESGQELTNSRRLLRAAIDRFQGRKLPSVGAEKLAIHLRDMYSGVYDQTDLTVNERLFTSRTIRDPYDLERAYNVRRSLDAIKNVSKWLSDVQGRRKALLFFSEGFDYDIYQPFDRVGSGILPSAQQAVASAQRANVNVYGIDPRGLSSFGEMIEVRGQSEYPQLAYGTFRGALNELLLAQESLISLSDETGGLAIVNSGDLAGGLGRIVLDNSRYYVLGYYSDSTKWSRNRFLKIEVRVKRPGLKVRARKGFLPPDTKAAERAREAEVKAGTSPALKAALSKPLPVGELPFRAFAASMKGGNNASVVVAVEIDGSSLKFEERDGRFVESVELSIVAADQRAKVQGGDRQTLNLNLVPQTHERVSRTGVRLVSRLDLPPGRYQIRIGAHETTGGTTGTVPYDIEVPDYSKTPFALSGIFLTSSSAESFATAGADATLGGLLPGPPVATRVFRLSETLTWFAEVHDNSSQAHAITYTTRVQDASDGREVFKSTDRRVVQPARTAQGQGFRAELPLRDLNPGKYVLQVEVESTLDGHWAQRELLFEVTQ